MPRTKALKILPTMPVALETKGKGREKVCCYSIGFFSSPSFITRDIYGQYRTASDVTSFCVNNSVRPSLKQ